jgi:hypothetical protein
MKKLVLTGAALVALASATYAQVVQQVGQQQFAQHNQFGANQTGTIQQVQSAGDPNRTNYGNYAITFQGTPNNTGANTLIIRQNDGSQGNRAGIGQSGGPNNSATINQNGGLSGLSGGATSTSATIGAPGEDGNFAGISQIGAANTAIINENNNSRRNKAETYQNGNGNTASTNQSNNAVSNTAFVYQGFTSQGVTSAAVNNASATIFQGKVNAGDVSTGSAVPEAVGNTAVITQTASNVTASIAQGSGSLIPGFSTNPGRADGVDARITQSATLTIARIDQGTGNGEAIGSKATVTQTATNQLAQITQGFGALGSDQGSTATVVQNGASGVAGSNAYISQGVNGATDQSQASITQTGSVANANAQIFQSVNLFGAGGTYSSGDKASITQSGQGVAASITQNGRNTAGGGESNGRDNNATITQGAGVVGNAGVTASIGNNGFDINGAATGVAVISQGASQGGDILQTNRNAATISQVAGTGLRAKVQQGGLGATFTDAAGNGFGLTGLNGTPVTLVGTIANDNSASITQTSGDNHNANIFQNGRFNSATVTQQNGNAHQALIIQTANSQRASATINQTSSGTGNAATILQFAGSNADGQGAFGNIATINQVAGSSNVAFVQQGLQGVATSSNDNVATITQNGSGNFARFLQVGNNNMVNITQNGNNNQVLNLAGDPGSYGSQQGYNNRLTLVQEGGNVGVTFKYTQIGNNNTQVVNQHF